MSARRLVVALAVVLLAAGCGSPSDAASVPAAPAPDAPPVPAAPPGYLRTLIPDPFFPGTTAAAATSWCEGTTRVHVVTSDTDGYDGQGPHIAQALEPNAPTCAGHG